MLSQIIFNQIISAVIILWTGILLLPLLTRYPQPLKMAHYQPTLISVALITSLSTTGYLIITFPTPINHLIDNIAIAILIMMGIYLITLLVTKPRPKKPYRRLTKVILSLMTIVFINLFIIGDLVLIDNLIQLHQTQQRITQQHHTKIHHLKNHITQLTHQQIPMLTKLQNSPKNTPHFHQIQIQYYKQQRQLIIAQHQLKNLQKEK